MTGTLPATTAPGALAGSSVRLAASAFGRSTGGRADTLCGARTWRAVLFSTTALAALALAAPAHAQTDWTGVTSNDWFTGSNWDTASIKGGAW